ncbi:MAG: ABC transporter permease, partial [Saprospiraceae bacterium]
GEMKDYGVDSYGVDYDFFPTLGIEIVEGRNFSREISSDTTLSVMVNEAMVKRLGWTNPIGKKYRMAQNADAPFKQVIGVVKDFHQESMYAPISALAFDLSPQNGAAHVQISASDAQGIQSAIAFTEKTFSRMFPEERFEYDFLDETYFQLYQADQVRARIFTLFSMIMIFIACLGLLGLASFTAEQRTKEIGVRKILGAQTTDIIYLLTRNFLVLVLLAALPAFIAAWFFADNWLGTFAYHADMNYTLYIGAFVIVLILTLFTTGYFALRAAQDNPIRALRYE